METDYFLNAVKKMNLDFNLPPSTYIHSSKNKTVIDNSFSDSIVLFLDSFKGFVVLENHKKINIKVNNISNSTINNIIFIFENFYEKVSIDFGFNYNLDKNLIEITHFYIKSNNQTKNINQTYFFVIEDKDTIKTKLMYFLDSLEQNNEKKFLIEIFKKNINNLENFEDLKNILKIIDH